MAVTLRATVVHRIRLIGALHTLFPIPGFPTAVPRPFAPQALPMAGISQPCPARGEGGGGGVAARPRARGVPPPVCRRGARAAPGGAAGAGVWLGPSRLGLALF